MDSDREEDAMIFLEDHRSAHQALHIAPKDDLQVNRARLQVLEYICVT
jgi:hypothetical protein